MANIQSPGRANNISGLIIQAGEGAPMDLSGANMKPVSASLPDRGNETSTPQVEAELKAVFTGKKTLGLGSTGPAVALVKDALERVGLEVDRDSAVITKRDVESIRDWQQSHGCKVDGTVGRETLALVNDYLLERSNSSLPGGFRPNALGMVKFGARDFEGDTSVATAQRALNSIFENHRGMRPLSEDGVYGEGTRNRVRLYQRSAGIAETGDIDERTLRSLQYDLGIKKVDFISLGGNASALDSSTNTVAALGSRGTAPELSTEQSQWVAKNAEYLNKILGEKTTAKGGTLSDQHARYVIQVLEQVPDRDALKAEYARVSGGKDLFEDFKTRFDGIAREAVLATWGKERGLVRPEVAAFFVREIDNAKQS